LLSGEHRREFRDKDFVIDDKGVIFCVIGNIHPKGSVIAYPRYFPDPGGQWTHGDSRYRRAMPSYGVKSLKKSLAQLESKYRKSAYGVKYAGIPTIAVDAVKRHLRPEVRLKEILKKPAPDDLERLTAGLASNLSRICMVPVDCLGVTGSILPSIHSSKLSDIDLTVYGRTAANAVRSILQSGDLGERIVRFKDEEFTVWSQSVADTYALSLEDAERICAKKWNYRLYAGRRFSIHPVLTEAEVNDHFEDFKYESLGLFTIQATVSGDADSLFMPHRYQLEDCTLHVKGSDIVVEELVSYEGIYGNVFRKGDRIEARGKIEKVTHKHHHTHYRLLIGSLEAGGKDYAKLR
jgi:predicted nucleotidyltransferase